MQRGKEGAEQAKEERVSNPNFIKAEVAPSNRSECRKCKTKIAKGTIRMAVCYDDGITASSPWRHLVCFYLPQQYIEAKIQPSDIRGYEALDEDDKMQVQNRITRLIDRSLEQRPDKRKKKGKQKGQKEDNTPKYMPSQDISLYQQGGYTEQERKEFYQYLEEYGKMTLPQLKAMLQYNEQSKSGTKQEVLERVADGWLLGSIPRCFQCEHGRLIFNRYNGKYSCKGFFDSNVDQYVRCGKKYKRHEIDRDEFA